MTSGNVRANLPGINKATKRLADGSTRVYYYHRATGKRLPGLPGSPEFLAVLGQAQKLRTDYTSGTLSGLIRAYEASPDFKKSLAESTQEIAKYLHKKIDAEYGSLPVVALAERAKVRQDFLGWRDRMAEKHPRGADNTLAHLAKVLSWSLDRGYIGENPLDSFKRVYAADRSDMIWLPAHIEAFTKVASPEMQLALTLALHTGQRQGDLLRLPWSGYDGTAIALRQGKVKRRVIVPCTKALRDTLDALPRKATVILTTADGRAWKARAFKQAWKETATAAGIDDLHFHDLRGTAVTMLSEAGATPQEIAAITGHSLKDIGSILDKYLARTRALAESAITKLEHLLANRLQTGEGKN